MKLTPQILAMYLGCRVLVNDQIHENVREELRSINEVGDCGGAEIDWRIKNCQPILRRLEDIQIEEAAHILQQTYFDHVTYPITDYRLYLNDAGNPVISIDNDWFKHSLTFGVKTGSIWSTDKWPSCNTKLKAEMFDYLRSRYFDLNGLIDSGDAIDAKTLTV